MILPSDIKGRNRIRDANIIHLFLEESVSQRLIAQKYGITQGRIAQILQRNAKHVISTIKDYDKLKRIHFYNHHIANSNDLPVARTKLELIEAKRKEFEGEAVINNVTQFLMVEKPSEKVSLPKPIENRSSELVL